MKYYNLQFRLQGKVKNNTSLIFLNTDASK
jgi:hypothetical protein